MSSPSVGTQDRDAVRERGGEDVVPRPTRGQQRRVVAGEQPVEERPQPPLERPERRPGFPVERISQRGEALVVDDEMADGVPYDHVDRGAGGVGVDVAVPVPHEFERRSFPLVGAVESGQPLHPELGRERSPVPLHGAHVPGGRRAGGERREPVEDALGPERRRDVHSQFVG